MHAADLIVAVPEAHDISIAKSQVAFIGALSAASSDVRIPHAAIIAGARSNVGSDELTLGSAHVGANRPIAHGLTFTAEGIDELVAGWAAFTRNGIPLTVCVGVTAVLECRSWVFGFALATASFVLENSSAIPDAHGVVIAASFIGVESVGETRISALSDVDIPITSKILTTRFRILVLEQATSAAELSGGIKLAHGSSQAGRLVQEGTETSANTGFRIPVAVDLRLAVVFTQ